MTLCTYHLSDGCPCVAEQNTTWQEKVVWCVRHNSWLEQWELLGHFLADCEEYKIAANGVNETFAKLKRERAISDAIALGYLYGRREKIAGWHSWVVTS